MTEDEYMDPEDYEDMKKGIPPKKELPPDKPLTPEQFKVLPKEQKETVIEKRNNVLKDYGLVTNDREELANERTKIKIAWIIALAAVVFVGGFLYFSSGEAYKPEVACGNLTAVCEGYSFNVTCGECQECPPCVVSCGDVEFPDELEITLKNSS